ncbi:hypothetical protein PHYSODRAFT_514712 [Phytophthora sojae]|uniref:Cysteine-rich protein n=1 Tax=Phytophthora sojae (strain P6497) TaxID=1094619 RepID=G4ZUB9_PHYSP|nr:hypothetical protein PHYSODRAFT_514712 [Phytophthora sojae]EGZ13393.1 hypothetical protein PHYSODRAFT_514712 [Phytophthora sojae]|eukprot:XP_009530822.1 hypothetical protein PHYSODRAFT_514712 [Phytophthora sojae]
MLKKLTAALVVLGLAAAVNAGPAAYGICQTGCNVLAVACYAATGAVFGTAIPAIINCNKALGVCMASCVAAGLIPTP